MNHDNIPEEQPVIDPPPTNRREKKPKQPLSARLILSRSMIFIGLALILIAGVYEAWDYPWYLYFQKDTVGNVAPPVEVVLGELPIPTLPPEDDEFVYEIPLVMPEEIQATPIPSEESGLSADSLFSVETKAPAASSKSKLTQYGSIRIPKLKISETVFVGTGKPELKKGCGYEIGTAHIGTQGNSVIAGHRSTTVKHPFKHLMKMAVGDLIYVTDNLGNTYTYEAIEVQDGQPWFIVKNNEIWVMNDRGEENPYCLTLITCHPYTKATHRVILWSKLVAINDEPFVAPQETPEP